MRTSPPTLVPHTLFRLLLLFAVLVAGFSSLPSALAQSTTTDQTINARVWQMVWGIPDAKLWQAGVPANGLNAAWLASDDDGDGMTNGAELAAGTDPFHSTSKFQVATLTLDANQASVSFPTIARKLYTVYGKTSLLSATWDDTGMNAIGDGALKTLPVLRSSGYYFFRVLVQDQSTAGDLVSDWAKQYLGYSFGSNISSPSVSSYNNSTLANALLNQDTVTVTATDPATTEPPDASTAAIGLGSITFTRSGSFSFTTITVPISVTAQAGVVAALGGTDYTTSVSGTDYSSGCPSSISFPPGVNSVVLLIKPKYNPARTGSATLTVTAGNPAQSGSYYKLGTPSSASVTIYPPVLAGAAAANGTGLTGAFYAGSNVAYTNAQTLGASVSATAAYSFTQTAGSSTQGSILVTYTGAPESPFAAGSAVALSFTSGLLNTTAYNGTTNVFSSSPYSPYTISTVSAPVAFSGVVISIGGTAVVTTPSAHSFAVGTPVMFTTTGALPTGLSQGTTYYVIAAGLTSTAFEVSTTPGGSPVGTSGTQSGTQTVESAYFTVPVATNGISLPTSASGNVTVTPFAGSTHAGNFGGTAVNYTYTKLTNTTGTAVISYPGVPAAAFANGGSVNLQFTAGSLYTGMNGLYDGNYLISSFNAPATISGITYSGALVTTPSAHGFAVGTPVTFSTTAALPTGLTASTITASTTYYVISAGLTSATFEVSTTPGGSAVTTSGTPSGTQSVQSASFTVNITPPPGVSSLPATGATSNATLTPFNAPAITRLDPTVDFYWGSGQPPTTSLQIQSNQNWGARWDSWLVPASADTYHFDVQATDGARVYVNNTLVIDGWAPGSSTSTPKTSDTLFPSGISLGTTPVPIRVEYYHLNAPTASINLRWKGSSGSFAGIPAASTYLTNGGSITGWSGLYWTNIGANAATPQTISSGVTISIASPAVVTTSSAHGFIAGTPVVFSTTGTLPTGLSAGSTYYVLAAGLTSTSFEVSTSQGGTPVATTGAQSGDPTVQSFTAFYGLPRYGDYPDAISNLSWTSQPTATLPSAFANNFSVRWDGYLQPTKTSTLSSITIANPAVLNLTAHGLAAGTPVVFSTSGFLPGALTPGTTYYVISPTTNSFQVSATVGGSAISTLGYTQSGTHSISVSGITDTYTFDVQASDGVRVYLDSTQSGTLTKIIEGWTADSSATTQLVSGSYSLTTGQQYHIRVEYFQTQNTTVTVNGLVKLRWKNTTTIPAMTAIPAANVFRADPLTGAGTTTTGLWADYYNNSTLTERPYYSAQDTSSSTITYTFNTSVPPGTSLGTGSNNNWAARFNTYLKATSTAGNYQFQLSALTFGRLVVNGTEVIPFTPGTSISLPIALTASQIVPVVVEFYDTGSNGQATLSWLTPSASTYATIPAANFFQDAGGTNPGVIGSYWANTAFIGTPFFADYQTQINYTSHTSTPGDSWATSAFSAGWDGYLSAATAGDYIFSLQAQAKARIYVNSTLVVDGFSNAAANPIAATITLPAGRVPIHVDFQTAANSTSEYLAILWQPPTATSLTTIPNTVLFVDATSAQQGVTATYFANRTQTAPYFYQVVENNNPQWGTSIITTNPPNAVIYGTGTPDPSMTGSNFSARWTGQVLPQYTEPYWFEVSSDDGARLWVNGQLILNQWKSQGNTKNVSNPVNLTAGVFYDIRLEYLNISGSAEAHLYWYSADQAEQIIPMNRLFPSVTGIAGAGPSGVTSPVTDAYALSSGSPYSYAIGGSNGTTFSATGLPSGLTLNSNTGVISGTPTAAGNYQYIVTTTTASGSSSAVVNLSVTSATGTITRDIWNGLTTGNVSELQDKIAAGTAASSTDSLTSLEDLSITLGDNTGERLRGYITAPVTGNYYFWIAANGTASNANLTSAELWVSNNDQPTSKVRRASVSGATNNPARTWNAQLSQKTLWLSLTGGKRYYFEVLHNTGSSGVANNLSVGWYLDPTGNTASPIVNGAGPAANLNAAGVVPAFALSPWDNAPSTTTSGTVYLASLAGSSASIKGSGGAYISVNGSTAIVHLNSSGLTSGALVQQIFAAGNTTPIFDLGAQDKNFPNLKTSDGGYTWNIQAADLTNLASGNVFIAIGTVNNPITAPNPQGELSGKFAQASGSQTPPALPSYSSQTWTENDSDIASVSRLLTQATFGPSPADIQYITGVPVGPSHTFRQWIDNQFTIAPSHHVPYTLLRLNGSPVTPYPDPLTANAWWLNSITGSDQLRQRIAFALSEILVTSTNGPLNNNDRMVSDYYDTLLDNAFADFRTILKQVSLTSAMGLYLNMQGNYKGSLVTGLHANENYGREIMQLFSIGLYRRWPDGSLVLDNTGGPIPTYSQAVITGMSQALTGWNYGQPLSSGRLPTSGPGTNYLDPMVLLASQHELGTKTILDNAVLPAAIVLSQSDTSRDPSPNPITVTSTSPTQGSGFTVQTPVTSTYDVYALNDLEQALNAIVSNGSAAPYVCRQLIQRLVTSNPKPDYVKRVVRAFNGQQNIDGAATGVVGDMKDVIRAILLDPEARSATAAADPGFGKQREPLLRVTGPARAFPTTPLTCTYRQQGGQVMNIKTPTAHGLVSDTVLIDNFVDSGTLPVPSPTTLQVKDVTPAYTYVGSTHIATINAPGYKAGDTVNIQFTSGALSTTSPYNTVQAYPVSSATTTGTSGNFTVDIGSIAGSPPATNQSTNANALTPNNFNFYMGGFTTITGYSISGATHQTVTIPATITPVSGCPFTVGQKVYIQFTTGSLNTGAFDGVYPITTVGASSFTITLTSSNSGTTSGNALIPFLTGGYTVTTSANQSFVTLNTGTTNIPLLVGQPVWINFSTTIGLFNSPIPAVSQQYGVTSLPPAYAGVAVANQFTITSPTVLTAGTPNSGSSYAAYPLTMSDFVRNGTCTLEYGTLAMGITVGSLTQGPLYSTTVFNYFYPDYQFPGPMASLGMTTPEFQLTDASDTMNLTNNVSNGVLSPSINGNGLVFFSLTGTACLDLRPYLTLAQTQDSAVAGLVTTLGNLLAGGNLTSATQTTITNYAKTLTAPTSSTDIARMSARVRAIIHLIVTSSEYAIQK